MLRELSNGPLSHNGYRFYMKHHQTTPCKDDPRPNWSNPLRTAFIIAAAVVVVLLLAGCTVVREGEAGVQRTLGKYSDTPNTGGIEFFNPLYASVVKLPVRTTNIEVEARLPSKEGLNVNAVISILYRVKAEAAPRLLREVGEGYEKNLILPVFRSAVADVSSRYLAKDMHTGSRTVIEKDIQQQMLGIISKNGIEIDAVLIKSISLPENLARAVEEKLEAEQRALRMQFVLNEAEQEAQRKEVEAKGIRDAQKLIAEGLNDHVLKFRAVEAFERLAQSPNAKVIITDGALPLLQTDTNVASPASTSSVK